MKRAHIIAGSLLLCVLARAAPAQTIAFDRPEAWAMKYFTAATSLSGLETPDDLRSGSLAVQFETGWLPPLSADEERIGFDGTTPEDLNQAPVFLRPRVAVGLPHALTVIVAFNPPLHTFGVTPRLFASAVEGPIRRAGKWHIGWRAHGQIGNVTAAVTCPASLVSFAPGSTGNPLGCTAASSDMTSLRYIGGELHAAYRTTSRFVPHAAAGAEYVAGAFHTGAEEYGQPDRTVLESRGVILTTSAGLGFRLASRWSISGDVFYAPLPIRRGADSDPVIDGMFNARALISYEVIR
jgi:hypothetical protein